MPPPRSISLLQHVMQTFFKSPQIAETQILHFLRSFRYRKFANGNPHSFCTNLTRAFIPTFVWSFCRFAEFFKPQKMGPQISNSQIAKHWVRILQIRKSASLGICDLRNLFADRSPLHIMCTKHSCWQLLSSINFTRFGTAWALKEEYLTTRFTDLLKVWWGVNHKSLRDFLWFWKIWCNQNYENENYEMKTRLKLFTEE